MDLKRVVVTGVGALTPIGNSVGDFWQALLQGVSGAHLITRFNPERFKCKIACEVKGFDPLEHFDRKELKKIDPFAQYGIVAAEEAIADAALDCCGIDKDRVGVIWGSGVGGVGAFEVECHNYYLDGEIPRFSPFFVPKMITDICAGLLSIRHGYHGPNYAAVAACASSAAAISDAFNLIRLGKATAIVTGGSESAVSPCGIGGFSAMMALSTRNDDPATASRPFDRGRDGFVLGEGAASIVLEELEHARARGAKIYAELTGVGLSADAHHITASHPEGKGAILAMRQAVEESGMQLSDVDHINTHGTSTPVGDISEPKAVAALFGDHAYKIALNSTKSMTGHLLGASACTESIATVLAIVNGIVPPTINHFEDDPDIVPLDFTFNKAAKRRVDFALCNSFGFGGHNICLAFRRL